MTEHQALTNALTLTTAGIKAYAEGNRVFLADPYQRDALRRYSREGDIGLRTRTLADGRIEIYR